MFKLEESKYQGVAVSAFGAASELVWSELDEKNYRLMPEDVLIKVKASSVNHFDVLYRSGYFSKDTPLSKHYVPGSDCSGIIVQKGRNVTEFNLNDRVYTAVSTKTGTYARYVVASAVNGTVHHLPFKISFVEGACYGIPYFLAYRILTRIGRVSQGASGAVGNAITQIGRALSLRMYGTAGSKEGIEVAKKCGALQVFNHDDQDMNNKIKNRVGGIDLLVENNPQRLQDNLELMNPGGRMIILGPHEEHLQIHLKTFLKKEVYLTGANLANSTVNDLLETGRFLAEHRIKPIVEVKFSMKNAVMAHLYKEDKTRRRKGQLVLKNDD